MSDLMQQGREFRGVFAPHLGLKASQRRVWNVLGAQGLPAIRRQGVQHRRGKRVEVVLDDAIDVALIAGVLYLEAPVVETVHAPSPANAWLAAF
jgi:hypothetical protein